MQRNKMFKYNVAVPENRKLRYIIHSDCKNEADDQYTVAHILMTPKLDVRGIIAGHFEVNFQGIPKCETAKASYDEITKLLDLMHVSGQYPVYMGASQPMADESTPIDSPGARFIIEEAMKNDDRPLFIGMQGAITDLASAILLEPAICNRMTAIWIGGGTYPNGGWEFNLMQDPVAANVVFKSAMPLWQVPMNAYKQFDVSLAELQYKVQPYGKVGNYLFEQLVELNECISGLFDGSWPHGETWGLGDEGTIAVLLGNSDCKENYDLIPAPTFDIKTMEYIPSAINRKIRVYHSLNVRLVLEDFFCKLAINFPKIDD